MIVEAQVTINAPKAAVWAVITDIENAAATIGGIETIEVLERPDDGLVGLKWRETRTMMGKTCTEDMWVTEAIENDAYKVRAESHGFVYLSTLSLAERDGRTTLTMSHDSQPQGFMARLLSVPMGLAFKGTMKKAFGKDLEDIKAAAERKPGEPDDRT